MAKNAFQTKYRGRLHNFKDRQFKQTQTIFISLNVVHYGTQGVYDEPLCHMNIPTRDMGQLVNKAVKALWEVGHWNHYT